MKNKIFYGWNNKYDKNYNQIFRKSLKIKVKEWIDKFLFEIFIEERKHV